MSFSLDEKQPEHVQGIFTRIAEKYDLMNRIMSCGRDIFWRKQMLREIKIPANAHVLDLGAGTGDLSGEVYRQQPEAQVTAADFTLSMMLTGRDWSGIHRCNADALTLPFADQQFDMVISGFLVRNVIDIDQTLDEMTRVLKPGGMVAILDMTRPRKNLLTPFINFFLNRVVPLIGTWITGQKEAYTYLPASTQNFLKAEELSEKMEKAGFGKVHFKILNFGTVAIHWGCKPVL